MDVNNSSFHKNRIVWAIVDSNIQISFTDKSHYEWFRQLGVEEHKFDYIPRGYILNIGDSENKEFNIVSYIGSEFKPTFIDSRYINTLKLFIELYSGYNKINWYSGLRVGNVGEIWKPIHKACEYTYNKYDVSTLSLNSMYKYDEVLCSIINNMNDWNVKDTFKKERENLINYINRTLGNNVNSCNNIATLKSRIYEYSKTLY